MLLGNLNKFDEQSETFRSNQNYWIDRRRRRYGEGGYGKQVAGVDWHSNFTFL